MLGIDKPSHRVIGTTACGHFDYAQCPRALTIGADHREGLYIVALPHKQRTKHEIKTVLMF